MKPIIKEYLSQNAVIVDVRSPQEFSGGHCEGSINIPLNLLPSKLGELKKDQKIIVCCASGARSAAALGILKSNGFNEVINAGPWANAVMS